MPVIYAIQYGVSRNHLTWKRGATLSNISLHTALAFLHAHLTLPPLGATPYIAIRDPRAVAASTPFYSYC